MRSRIRNHLFFSIYLKKVLLMKKLFFPVLLFVCWQNAFAQEKFLDKLVKPVNGQGTVRVIQDAEITRLVNGSQENNTVPSRTEKPVSNKDTSSVTQVPQGDNEETAAVKTVRKMKANGYRIQVYAGGNSRDARMEAQRMANKVKSYFSDMTTYTHFQSPRWICRVGDFRTYEEASQALHEMRETKQFDEALIVKSVIQIPY